MQFTFNKTRFLADRHCEEPQLTAAVKLDEALNASWGSMASRSLSPRAAETAICIGDKRRSEETSMTLTSSNVEQLVGKSRLGSGPAPLRIFGQWRFFCFWRFKRIRTSAEL